MITEFSEKTGVPVDLILGRSRNHIAVDARHLYWKLLRKKTRMTMVEIGKLNDRNHSTISDGIISIDNLLNSGDKRVCAMWEKVKDINF